MKDRSQKNKLQQKTVNLSKHRAGMLVSRIKRKTNFLNGNQGAKLDAPYLGFYR